MATDREVLVIAGVRTPFALAGCELAGVPGIELGRIVAREVVERTAIDPADIDELVAAHVHESKSGSGAARAVARAAKLPDRVPGFSVERGAASGLAGLVEAALRIRGGECDLVLVVAFESGSQAVHSSGVRPVPAASAAAESLARRFGIDRDAQDRFAERSHLRAASERVRDGGDDDVVPVPIGPEYSAFVERDGGVRDGITLEELGRLRPATDREYGTVTDGNVARDADGAVGVLLASGRFAARAACPVLGRIVSWGFSGCEPQHAGLGPVFAAPQALRRAGRVTLGEIERFELHESSAAEVLACERAFASRAFAETFLGRGPLGEIDPQAVNVRGGAIAFGHPAGASGARMTLGLLRELSASGLRRGLAAAGTPGGQGAALVVEAGP